MERGRIRSRREKSTTASIVLATAAIAVLGMMAAIAGCATSSAKET